MIDVGLVAASTVTLMRVADSNLALQWEMFCWHAHAKHEGLPCKAILAVAPTYSRVFHCKKGCQLSEQNQIYSKEKNSLVCTEFTV